MLGILSLWIDFLLYAACNKNEHTDHPTRRFHKPAPDAVVVAYRGPEFGAIDGDEGESHQERESAHTALVVECGPLEQIVVFCRGLGDFGGGKVELGLV